METIRLNKRKKHIKILWKRIGIAAAIVILIAFYLTLTSHFRFSYRYTLVNGKEKIILGISDNPHLRDDAMIEEAEEIKKDHREIAYFKENNKIKVHWTIVKKENPGEADQIKEAYKQNIDFYVYAHQITIEKKSYIVPANQGYETIRKFKEKNPKVKDIFLQGTYAKNEDIMSLNDIDNMINNYKK